MKSRMTKGIFLSGLVLVASLLALMQGCAYYNTFYNAKNYYEAGERTNRNTSTGQSHVKNYEKCLEAGARLLELYPKSRWVDDCLLLMGKAYFRTDKLPKAQRKFEELISNFPRSKLIPEARLWLAETLVKMRRSEEAIPILEQLRASSDAKNLVAQASFRLGNIHFDTTRYREAADAFGTAAQRYRTKPDRAQSLYMLGRSLFQLRDFQGAKQAFDQIPKLNPSRELTYQALRESGRCMAELGQTEAALELLRRLRDDIRYENYSSGIDLTLAKIESEEDRFDDAARIYTSYLEKNPTGSEKAEAYFYVGIIYRDHYRDLAQAAAYFDSVQNAGGAKVLADSASAQAKMLKGGLAHISKWIEISAKLQHMDSLLNAVPSTEGGQPIAPPSPSADSLVQDSGKVEIQSQTPPSADSLVQDSAKVEMHSQTDQDTIAASGRPEQMPGNVQPAERLPTQEEIVWTKRDLQKVLFQIGEFFLHDLQDQDSAFYFFHFAAQDTMDRHIQWKANLVLAELAGQRGADSVAIRSYYEAALATPGIPVETENRARAALGLPLKESPRDTLREKYLKLEGSVLDTTMDIPSILMSLDSMMVSDTSSVYFLKSLWAKAYFYEHRLSNRDSARAAYQHIIALFPDSAFATTLAQRLDTTALETATAENVAAVIPTESDTTHSTQEPGWPPPEESLLGRRGR
jgi:TolA-binding protein